VIGAVLVLHRRNALVVMLCSVASRGILKSLESDV
jgi:hypothetical protein